MLEVQCDVFPVCDDLGCHVDSKVYVAVYQEISEHLMLQSADKLYGNAGFLFQQDLGPAHKTTSKWFVDLDITVFDWPANLNIEHVRKT